MTYLFRKKFVLPKKRLSRSIQVTQLHLVQVLGGVVGGCGAVGAWTLVSFAGSASTGTAIGTLSGAAGSNATLAWFGGGALAAGGAGMAGGTLVLGSLVFAPLVYFAARGSHKKSAEIEKEVVRVDADHQKLKDVIPDTEKMAEELFNTANTIKQLCRNLRKTINDQHTKLNSLSWFGFLGFRFKRYLRIPLKPKERDAVNKITDAINDFLLNFNLEKNLYD